MKNILILPFFLLPVILNSQVTDDFSDGNFTEDPSWTGDTGHFEVNTARQLHLKSSGNDTACLVTESPAVGDAQWDLWLKLSFNTSANNFARIYVVSDRPDLKNPLSGYFLQAGGSSDSLVFYRQNGTALTRLFSGNTAYTGNSTNILRIRILHDPGGMWHLYTAPEGSSSFTEEGSALDTSVSISSHAGFFCRYTSSNATKFYFDDFYAGPRIRDTMPPDVLSAEIIAENIVQVTYSEIPEPVSSGNPVNYFSGIKGHPSEVDPDPGDPRAVHLIFSTGFPSVFTDSLTILNIRDLASNMAPLLRVQYFRNNPASYDVVINEIMADPTPQTALPDAEYVELFNRTEHPVRLKDWIFQAGESEKILPDVTLNPKKYLLLARSDWMSYYGETVRLFTSDYTLTNDGMELTLKNENGRIIHSVNYSADWYDESFKKEGGWSLEMVDPANPCGCDDNWKASTDLAGGTPGKGNAVFGPNPDITSPTFLGALPENGNWFRIQFTESMDSAFLPPSVQWKTGDPGVTIDSIAWCSPGYRSLLVKFREPLTPGSIYRITVDGILKDCAGNVLDTSIHLRIALSDTLMPGSVLINEILPDPYPGGERFIELYNSSGSVLDLKELLTAAVDSITDSTGTPGIITEESSLLFPGDFIVLTRDHRDIESRYRVPGNRWYLEVQSLPEMGDDGGYIAIVRRNDLCIVDRMKYNGSMQFPLLRDPQGVSLERLSPWRSSADPSNWHSASEGCGWATPGAVNSQFMKVPVTDHEVTLFPAVFSPDNDGYNDVLYIKFRPDSPGYLANVLVFDSEGRTIRHLTRNRYLSAEDVISWEGLNDDRQMAGSGIYILFVEMLKPDGTVKRVKKVTVLGTGP